MNADDLYTILDGLPRSGPGSDAATREAILRLPTRPGRDGRVLDLGCGPGRQTLVLAQDLKCRVIALDIHAPFLAQLSMAAVGQGLAERITPALADIATLDFAEESLDIVWAEGSLFLLGVRETLDLIWPMVKKDGYVVASEVSWLVDHPPADIEAYWAEEYPDMRDIRGNVDRMAQAGFEVFEHFVLKPKDWWPDYYLPLTQRLAALRTDADPSLLELIEMFEREILMFQQHHESFGYVFYVMQKM